MFEELEEISTRPKPFEFYTANDLWTDEHTSKQMLSSHLNEGIKLKPAGSILLDVYSFAALHHREEAAMYEADLPNGLWSANKYYGSEWGYMRSTRACRGWSSCGGGAAKKDFWFKQLFGIGYFCGDPCPR